MRIPPPSLSVPSLLSPPDLIKVLYSLILLLMRSWLVKSAFYIKKKEGRKDRNNE